MSSRVEKKTGADSGYKDYSSSASSSKKTASSVEEVAGKVILSGLGGLTGASTIGLPVGAGLLILTGGPLTLFIVAAFVVSTIGTAKLVFNPNLNRGGTGESWENKDCDDGSCPI
jgi:hypothetical protein